MYCNASLLKMIFIFLIKTLQHDIDACLRQSLFIEYFYKLICMDVYKSFLSFFQGLKESEDQYS
mgnify:FL=1